MHRRSPTQVAILAVFVAFAGVGIALAGETVVGAFRVNNDLPDGWDLSTVLLRAASAEVVATQTVSSDGSTVSFSFAGVDPGSYRVRLLASRDDTVLALAETTVLEVGAETSGTPGNTWKAIGSGGTIFGKIDLLGPPPEGKMILISLQRVDIDLTGKFPDQQNAFTIEVEPDEIESGSVAYEMSGLSYGLYEVALIAYHYDSHTTKPIEAYPERLVVDLDHRQYRDIDFAAAFSQ